MRKWFKSTVVTIIMMKNKNLTLKIFYTADR